MPEQTKLEQLIGKVMGDFAGAMSAALVRVGEQTGLFRHLAVGGADSTALAKRSGTAERYVREWLAAMAAAQYVTYDPATEHFSLTPEQASIFAVEGTPAYLPAMTDILTAAFHDEPKVTAAFKSGAGIYWGDHHPCLFCGMERFFRVGVAGPLVEQWLPALEGVVEKLKSGARVADIGCGHGLSTLAMAKAFPKSIFIGFDFYVPSVEHAADLALQEGVTNARFEVAAAKTFPGTGYDLVTIIDALHDMGDPVGAAKHASQALKPDGTFMVVEPRASDKLEENFNLYGQLAYGASTFNCVPTSLSQEVGLALGAQAGEARLSAVIKEGGFSRVRIATEAPTKMVLEAKP